MEQLFFLVFLILSTRILLFCLGSFDDGGLDINDETLIFHFNEKEKKNRKSNAAIWSIITLLNLLIVFRDPFPYLYITYMSFITAFANFKIPYYEPVLIKGDKICVFRGPLLTRKTFSFSSLFRVQLTKNQICFYQENVRIARIHLKQLREEDISRLKSAIESHIPIRTH